MAVIIAREKCTSCGLCVKLCPGDLMALDPKTGKARIRDNDDCWNCWVCVKYCPTQAITLKLPKSIAKYDATLVPKISEDKIEWTLIDPDGKVEKFVIPRKRVGG
ncbi:MAG: 4Fe-4S binding protein [Candidatus Hadarchaeales archaeon]